jgi:hypothetical protein
MIGPTANSNHFVSVMLNNASNVLFQIVFPDFIYQSIFVLWLKNQMNVKLCVGISHETCF